MNASVSPISMDTGMLFLSIVGYVTMATGCPDMCQCNLDYFVYCRNANIGDLQLKSLVEKVPLKVRLLDLAYNDITTIPSGIFSSLHKLKILNLDSNKIKSISKGAFLNLPSLEEVNLSNNDIREMPLSLWQRMGSLRKLNLADNYIGELQPRLFSSLEKLTYLNLASNQIKFLKETMFSNLKLLTTLDLSNNIVRDIANGSFVDLVSLQFLDISYNMLHDLHSVMFTGLRKLQILNVGYNKISDLRDIYKSDFATSLTHLHIVSNNLTRVRDYFFTRFRYLRELYLDGNNIASISDRSFMGLNLKILSVSHNKMTALTKEMFRQLRGVQLVDFSHNRISSLSTGVFDSFRDSVITLKMDHNKLDFIHHGHFRSMLHLQCLNLTRNNINRIEDNAFHDLKDLRDLALAENQLETVKPDMVSGPTLLENLYLMCNPLRRLVGFTYDLKEESNLLTIHMNLTLGKVNESSIHVTWPYQQGSQIYWTLKVKCLDETRCKVPPAKDKYLEPYKMEHVVSGLSPHVEYYVCVNPVFVNDIVHIHQCIYVTSRVPILTTDTVIRVTESLTSNTSRRCVIDLTFLILIMSMLQLT